jgi:hypothetical protein
VTNWIRNATRRALRLVLDYGGIPFGLCLLIGLFVLMGWCVRLAWEGTSELIGTIKDPTERGLAYLAVAIVVHAVFGKSSVDVKVDGSGNKKVGN